MMVQALYSLPAFVPALLPALQHDVGQARKDEVTLCNQLSSCLLAALIAYAFRLQYPWWYLSLLLYMSGSAILMVFNSPYYIVIVC